MPTHIDTATLNSLTETELMRLWRTIADEMAAMPEGSDAKAEAAQLLALIHGAIIRKRNSRYPQGPRFL